jgi:hypothetical protein
VYAVGPFIPLKSPPNRILFVYVAVYRNEYDELARATESLATAYAEFLILPEPHLIQAEIARLLEEEEDKNWMKMKAVSIRWARKS